jgi:hypothetical protein
VEQKILDKIGEIGEIGEKSADRRDFLKKAGKVAVTVPAVALLLSANATPAAASGRYGRGDKKPKKPGKKLGPKKGDAGRKDAVKHRKH